jgi:hypothetical protein
VLVAGASDPAYGTALGNTSDAFSIAGTTVALNPSTLFALQVNGGVVLSGAHLGGGARVLGMLGNVTTTQMPGNTGDQVAFWADASAMPTTGFPVGGGILGVDATTGLGWKGKAGVETTIAPHGESGNTTKRRLIGFRTRAERGSQVAGSTIAIISVDCATLNGRAFVNGELKVRAHVIAAGLYPAVYEYLVVVPVNGSSVPDPGTPVPQASGKGGIGTLALSFDAVGTALRLVSTAGSSDAIYFTWLEIDGAEW